MMDEHEQRLIGQAREQDDVNARIGIARDSRNPVFLSQYAQASNWDDGAELARAIADNPCCDMGTALHLFWLAEGMSYLTGEVPRNDYNGTWADLCETLIARIPAGFYLPGPVGYDPSLDRVQTYLYAKRGVPAVFYTPVAGHQQAS